MTAAAADRNTLTYGIRKVREHDVAAAVKIYLGTLVALDSSGNANPAADTAGLKLAGVSRGDMRNGTSTVDNTTGAAGDLHVEVFTSGTYKFAATGLTKADIGKPVFVSDDQTVTLTPGKVFAGILKDIDGATGAIVDIEPATLEPGVDSGKLFVLSFFWASTVGSSPVTLINGFELPYAFRVLRGYAEAKTAPGSTYKCTVTITDGTTAKGFDIETTATHGEDEAINQVYAANADMDITLVDDNASASTADVSIMYVCERL